MDDRDNGLRAAVQETDEPATLEQTAYDELTRLWGDLHQALTSARNGEWSIGCDAITRRIVRLTRALGRAARWQDVQIGLLENGVYQRLHDLMGVEVEPPDMAVVAEERRKQEGTGG